MARDLRAMVNLSVTSSLALKISRNFDLLLLLLGFSRYRIFGYKINRQNIWGKIVWDIKKSNI